MQEPMPMPKKRPNRNQHHRSRDSNPAAVRVVVVVGAMHQWLRVTLSRLREVMFLRAVVAVNASAHESILALAPAV